MKIEELSITDLKASLDFIREFLKEMVEKAKKENINTESIPAYRETLVLEDKIYNRLQNVVRMLE